MRILFFIFWLIVASYAYSGDEFEFVKELNTSVNNTVLYVKDKDDEWKTPEQTEREGGDCEDIAILKYHKLKSSGVNVNRLKFAVVYAKDQKTMHMVLLYNDYVLDNLTDEIKALGERYDLSYMYSFNSKGVYANGGIILTNNTKQIAKWNELKNAL